MAMSFKGRGTTAALGCEVCFVVSWLRCEGVFDPWLCSSRECVKRPELFVWSVVVCCAAAVQRNQCRVGLQGCCAERENWMDGNTVAVHNTY